MPLEKLAKLTRGSHQGIVVITSRISFHSLEGIAEQVIETKKQPLFIILDQISDLRNFAAIIRTAECTGVDAVIIQKKGGAPVSGNTVKTSADAIFKIPICKFDHIKDTIYYLQGFGIKTIGATEKTDYHIYTLDLNRPIAIEMGSENKGISRSVLDIL